MKTGTCRELSLEDRREWRVPAGCEAYFIRLPDAAQEMRSDEQIILLRQYDIYTDTWPVRAFSRHQWEEANKAWTQDTRDVETAQK